MKNIELILGIAATIASLMVLFLIPFGGPLAAICLSSLSVFYMLFGIVIFNNTSIRNLLSKKDYEDVLTIHFLATLGMGFAMSSALIGILFKIMRWPNASLMLGCGLFFMFNIFMIAFYRYHKTNQPVYPIIFRRMVLIGGAGLLLFLIPNDKLLEFRYRNYPTYIQAVKKYNTDPDNLQLQAEVRKEKAKINLAK
jgi:lipid-A-disaccharide synthase-like uncharacterized protein